MFEFKTPQWEHQRKAFKEHKDTQGFALFWEQGTGKSKGAIDQFSWAYDQKKIGAVLLLATNGAHRNWVTDEMPTHCPFEWEGFVWTSSKAKNKSFRNDFIKFMAEDKKLRILTMSYDALLTEKAATTAKWFVQKTNAAVICDETTLIKNPSALRTKQAVEIANMSNYRRILTGTPVVQSPFDIYSQMQCLDKNFWMKHDGVKNYFVFTQKYGVYRKCKRIIKDKEHKFNLLVEYKNVGRLNQIIAPYSSRVLKEDVLDLPPKIYQPRYFELEGQQKKLYTELKEELYSQLNDSDISVQHVLQKSLMLQNITSGYLTDDDGMLHQIKPNPKLALLKETCESIYTQGIIFSHQIKSLDLIAEMLRSSNISYLRHDGTISDDERAQNRYLFQQGKAQWMIGNPATLGRSFTFVNAKVVIYYSNSYKLEERLQSEDRVHRGGQNDSVSYIDLVAENTIDEHALKALRSKMDIASQVTGDDLKKWLV